MLIYHWYQPLFNTTISQMLGSSLSLSCAIIMGYMYISPNLTSWAGPLLTLHVCYITLFIVGFSIPGNPTIHKTGHVIICAWSLTCAHCLQSAPDVWLLGMSPANLIDSQAIWVSISAFKICFFTQEALNLISYLWPLYTTNFPTISWNMHVILMDPFTM